MKIRHILFVVALGSLLLAACGSSDAAIATGIAQTQQISELQTAAAASDTPAGTDTPAADTSTPAPQSSATSSIPYVSVSVDTHCRSGPRIDYKLLTTILIGEKVEVLAVSAFPEYVVVKRLGGSGDCWLWLRYADQTDFSGYNLPVATQPPTSTPTRTPTSSYTPSPTWTPSPTP